MISYRRTTHEEFEFVAKNALEVYDSEPLVLTSNMVTLKSDDVILGIFCLDVVWGSVLIVSAILTKEIYQHPLTLVRFLNKEAQAYFKRGFHRIQIDVRVGYEAGHKFAKAIGFIPEGVMKKYGPNEEDHILYARTT